MFRGMLWPGLVLLTISSVAFANELLVDPSVKPETAPASGATKLNIGLPSGHIVLRASDPRVTEVMRRHSQSKSTFGDGRSFRRIKPRKPISRLNASTATDPLKPPGEPELIELEVPETQPKVVNRSKSFVFKSISDFNKDSASGPKNLQDRQRQIELLRQSGKT